jgi:excisionase family DNA binding protein
MDKEKLFLRSKDVAQLLDCSPDDIYGVISKGEMPAIKRGRYWLFRYEDVVAYKEREKKNAS